MLPAVLDQTILATALPTIAADLGSLTDLSWVVTAYVVAAASTTPLWGKLGDRYGRKLLLEIALTGFVAASALCGLAQDIDVPDPRPRRAGRGRRRPHDARDGERRRSRLAARSAAATRATSRPPSPWRRSSDRCSAALLVEQRRLAARVLRQPPHRPDRAGRAAPLAAGAGARAVRPPARPAGRRRAGARDDDVHARLHPRRRSLRLGLGADRPAVRRRARRSPSRSCCASGARPIRSCRSRCCAPASCPSRAPRSSSAPPRCSP